MIRRWLNPARGRYYIAVVSDDLFGGRNLLRFWGGCDSRRGGQLSRHYEDTNLLDEELRRIANRRRQRNYEPT